jgi:hypothetical protein
MDCFSFLLPALKVLFLEGQIICARIWKNSADGPSASRLENQSSWGYHRASYLPEKLPEGVLTASRIASFCHAIPVNFSGKRYAMDQGNLGPD